MTQRKFISRFTPSRTAPEDLEAIFVQRENILSDAVDRIREGVNSKNKHHLLFIGPRGCGKTHFITLLYHRLSSMPEITKGMCIAWLNEDETTTSFLKLLIRIYDALAIEEPTVFTQDTIEALYDSPVENKAEVLGEVMLKKLGDRSLLVLVENLDALFESLGIAGQKDWRAFIQNHPVFNIVGTAQRLVEGISSRNAPFYGTFQKDHFQALKVKQAALLLEKIAQLNGDRELATFLREPKGRTRVRALHHLSGGNHRIYITLSEFITRDSLDDLVQPFEEMVDELTPYYQERIRTLPAQQREIMELLCGNGKPMPVKDIARQLFATHQSIASQLKKLREMGYVESHPRGRESLYELREPLMRICVEVKNNHQSEPLKLIVDFLRVWYECDDLQGMLGLFSESTKERACVTEALRMLESEIIHPRIQFLLEDYETLKDLDTPEATEERIEILRDLAEEQDQPEDWRRFLQALNDAERYDECVQCATLQIQRKSEDEVYSSHAYFARGYAYSMIENYKNAVEDLTVILEFENVADSQRIATLAMRGAVHIDCGNYNQALVDLTTVIELESPNQDLKAVALINRGYVHEKLSQPSKALDDYSTVINLEGISKDKLVDALYARANVYKATQSYDEQIGDCSSIIEMKGVSLKMIADALCMRGYAFMIKDMHNESISDFNKAISHKNISQSDITFSLFGRAVSTYMTGSYEKAINDLNAILEIKEISNNLRITAYWGIAKIHEARSDWQQVVSTLNTAMSFAKLSTDISFSYEFVVLILRSSLDKKIWRQKISLLFKVYADHDFLSALGDGLVSSLEELKKEPLNEDGLSRWLAVWEEVGQGHQEFIIPLRIFRTGIEYIKSEDKSVFLDLVKEERSILIEALGLDSLDTDDDNY